MILCYDGISVQPGDKVFLFFLLFCREHVKTYRLLAKTPWEKANTSDM